MNVALSHEFAARVRRNEPLSRHTSWHVGGPAEVFFNPRDRAELAAFLQALPRRRADASGSASAATCWCATAASAAWSSRPTARSMRSSASTRPRCRPRPGSPARASRAQCIKWGLGPAEFFAGIPGTLGGALAMNAGAFGGETWRHVLERRDHRSQRPRAPARGRRVPHRLPPGGRAGRRGVVPRRAPAASSSAPARTRARCALLLAAAQGHAADRRVELRLGVHQSAGRSRRAPHRSAGLKGFRIGDASVSQKHANFIINHGAARAADVERLIAHVRDTVARSARHHAAHPKCASWECPPDAPQLRPEAAAPRHRRRASSAAWRCCSAATRASARSRCCPATRCSRRSSAAASMPTPSIRATRRSRSCSRSASSACGSRCTARAARTARCRARSSTSACPTPAAASWARPSAWTSCAPSAWRRPSASRPRTIVVLRGPAGLRRPRSSGSGCR